MTNKKTIIIESNAANLASKGAEIFSKAAKESVGLKGRFAVAISGGSTPRYMHGILAEEPYLSDIPWEKTHIFWVDERCVPDNDPASNFGLARKDFLDQVPIPQNQIYPMSVEAPPEERAGIYQSALIDFFHLQKGESPVFDLIFLGTGKDGHTASLFPGQKALDERERLVISVKGGDPYVSRLTMTFPVLNHAKRIIFMVSGKNKADIVKTILEFHKAKLPAQRIQPLNGILTWLLDSESASMLSKEHSHEKY
ncbi:MAG: 6-phosphogluconolactonase [Proteobacteria bacterium]|nr:6-phosphogluconolactonase [Pseudomonadota bacterium]